MSVSLFNASTAQGKILSLLIKAKGLDSVEYAEKSQYAPDDFAHESTLVDNGHVIHGTIVIALYLEQRYPSPALLPQDPEKASIVMMLFRAILQHGRAGLDLSTYKLHLCTHGYITGDRASFVDVAVAALASEDDPFWSRFIKRLQDSWGSWSDDPNAI